MPSSNAFALPPSTARFQLSTVNSRLLCSNSFRLTHFCKNASASPLESHTFKTKDLKPFRITYFQKSGGGLPLILSRAKDTCHANQALLSKSRPVETVHLPSAA